MECVANQLLFPAAEPGGVRLGFHVIEPTGLQKE